MKVSVKFKQNGRLLHEEIGEVQSREDLENLGAAAVRGFYKSNPDINLFDSGVEQCWDRA